MSKIILTEQSSAPATPASGKVAVYANADGNLAWKDDAGAVAVAQAYTIGAWTPTITAVTGTGATYASQVGRYVIFEGSLALVMFSVTLTDLGTLSGGLFIDSLPIACGAHADLFANQSIMIDQYDGGDVPYIQFYPGQTKAYLIKGSGTGAHGVLEAADIAATSVLRGSFFYML